MAIFVTLLNLNPTLLNMQTLVNIVVREITAPSPQPRSNQVASFVMSHLSALAFHNNLITKQRWVSGFLPHYVVTHRALPDCNCFST